MIHCLIIAEFFVNFPNVAHVTLTLKLAAGVSCKFRVEFINIFCRTLIMKKLPKTTNFLLKSPRVHHS